MTSITLIMCACKIKLLYPGHGSLAEGKRETQLDAYPICTECSNAEPVLVADTLVVLPLFSRKEFARTRERQMGISV